MIDSTTPDPKTWPVCVCGKPCILRRIDDGGLEHWSWQWDCRRHRQRGFMLAGEPVAGIVMVTES